MEEFIETCRTCLSHDKKLLSITSLIETNCRILDYFEKYLQINMSPDDSFPPNICLKCLNKILDVRKFYLQCQDSENYLRLKFQIPLKVSNSLVNELQENEKVEYNLAEEITTAEQNNETESKLITEDDNSNIKEELNEEYLELDDIIDDDSLTKPKIEENVELDESNGSENFAQYEILEEYITETNINEVNSKSQENYKCELCSENFKYQKNFEFHKRLAHNNYKWNEFNSINVPVNLYKSTAFFNQNALTCRICQYKFAFRTNYDIHMKRHAQIKKSTNESCVCPVCGKKFENKRKLQKHTYRHNNKFNEIPCPICNKTFKAKYHLKIHMNQHTGAKPFKCNVCNKSFVSPSSLRLHKTLHDGKKIQCPMCDTKLAAKTQLKIHMRMHTNERPYTCSQCPKRYKQLCALKVHLATHSGVKSVQCEECSACFYSKNHLLSHKIKIHRPKRFHCNKCIKQFPTPFQIKAHLLSVHKICIKDLSSYEISKVENKQL